MCNPAIAMMAVSAVMAAGSSMMQTNAANKQAAAQGAAANVAARYDYQRLAEQRGEVDEAAAENKLQRQLQTKREHGRIAVAMGEAGVGGSSAMRVMNNAMMQGSYDISVIEANRASKARQITAEGEAVHARAQSRVNLAESMSVSPGMGMLSAGMAGIKGGAEGYMAGKSMFKGSTMKTKLTLNQGYHPH